MPKIEQFCFEAYLFNFSFQRINIRVSYFAVNATTIIRFPEQTKP